jgi:hypothetical protein
MKRQSPEPVAIEAETGTKSPKVEAYSEGSRYVLSKTSLHVFLPHNAIHTLALGARKISAARVELDACGPQRSNRSEREPARCLKRQPCTRRRLPQRGAIDTIVEVELDRVVAAGPAGHESARGRPMSVAPDWNWHEEKRTREPWSQRLLTCGVQPRDSVAAIERRLMPRYSMSSAICRCTMSSGFDGSFTCDGW